MRDKQWMSPENRLLLQKEEMWAQGKKILHKGSRAALIHLPAQPRDKQGLSEQFCSISQHHREGICSTMGSWASELEPELLCAYVRDT